MVKKHIFFFFIFLFLWVGQLSAQIYGVVTDADTGEPLPYVNIVYEDKKVGVVTNIDGEYSIQYRSGMNELTFSIVGYNTVVKKISDKTTELNVEMRTDIMLDEVVVEPKKEKYSRKNNPAVELMKKVINAKKASDLSLNDYYRYTKYQKITFSLNNITVDSINESKLFKKYPFLKDQVEVCNVTGKNILPISVDETVTEKVYRKDPHSEKNIIKGLNSSGINELFSTRAICLRQY